MGFLFLLLKAGLKLGHDHKGFGFFVTDKVPEETLQDQHFTDAMMEIELSAGGIPDGKGIEIFWDNKSEKIWGHLFLNNSGSSDEFKICINAGGDRQNRIPEGNRQCSGLGNPLGRGDIF